MKTTAIFAALLAVAAAAPAEALSSGVPGLSKRLDEPRTFRGEKCSSLKAKEVQKTPLECVDQLFCKDKITELDPSCGLEAKRYYPKAELDTYTEECQRQAYCHVIRTYATRPPLGARVKDIELPGEFSVYNQADENKKPCSEYVNNNWYDIPSSCVYNVLCEQPKLDGEPECTYLNLDRKKYSAQAFRLETRECARELLCFRSSNTFYLGTSETSHQESGL